MIGMQAVMNDPWWIVLIKVVGIFVLLLTWTIFNVWFERRVIGRMQNRKGPIMNGPLGLGQALGDGVKLLFKEDMRPARTDALVFSIAPGITAVCAFLSWAVIPLGGEVRMFGVDTRLQLTDLPVAVLLVLAIAGVGFYGVVLAGWSSNGTYSLMGSMRATAQVISYELAMGLSLVAVFMFAGSMSTSEIVAAQQAPLTFFGWNSGMPGWYALLLLPSFIIYVISMFGETNRLPFDFSECESEIVSGHITDFTGFRYALYFLAEYINMATVSAVCTTLFLGGYYAPWPLNHIEVLNTGWITLLWFVLKVQVGMFVFTWARGSLARFRYDQFMALGWKVLIPISLVWIMLLALFRGARVHDWGFGDPAFLITVGVIIVAVFAVIWFGGEEKKVHPDDAVLGITDDDAPFDAFAGGYPVPPMPSQKLIAAQPSQEPVAARRSIPDGADA